MTLSSSTSWIQGSCDSVYRIILIRMGVERCLANNISCLVLTCKLTVKFLLASISTRKTEIKYFGENSSGNNKMWRYKFKVWWILIDFFMFPEKKVEKKFVLVVPECKPFSEFCPLKATTIGNKEKNSEKRNESFLSLAEFFFQIRMLKCAASVSNVSKLLTRYLKQMVVVESRSAADEKYFSAFLFLTGFEKLIN